jgi:CDP-4-dehydro-6-deoxyglucose reductase
MTARIRLLPSQREYEAAPQETLLEAALRAGLSPGYRCGNGSCGECKARVRSGRIGLQRPHDYAISAADRQAGVVLMCCASPETDLELETDIALSVDDIPEQTIVTRVAKLEALGPGVRALHLRTPRSQALRFLAGQHVRLEIAGVPPRHKSLASCPCNATHLEFHIRRAEGDAFAEHVFNRLKTGDAVQVTGPAGRFVFHERVERPAILLAYETGFAAIKSLIEQSLAVEYAWPLHLYRVARTRDGHYADNYCRALADAHERFRYSTLVGDERDSVALGLLSGARQIVHDYPDLGGCEVYASGPDSNMPAAAELLAAHGLPAAQLHVDDLKRLPA